MIISSFAWYYFSRKDETLVCLQFPQMGQFPQDGNWPCVMSFFKVWKLAVTKREGQPLFFQLFMRYLFSCIIRGKKSRSF